MSTTLLAGSVMLVGITYATFSANAPGSTPSKTEAQGVPLITTTVVQEVQAPQVSASHDLPGPQIICGMKLWSADPAIDPGIHKPLPEGAAGAKIRRIPATECVAGASTARREVGVHSGTFYVEAVRGQSRSLIRADVRQAYALIPIVLGTAW
jgi:hypothetical protein